MDYQSVLDEVETWTLEDRIRLVQDLSERLVEQGREPEISEAMRTELDRRIEELDRNPEAGVPWEAVKARALERFSK